MTPENINPSRSFPRSADGQKRKQKAPLVGHEAFLKALETGQAVIRVELMSGEVLKGTVKHFDKYTISLKVDDADGTHQVYVLFKHAIESFWTNPKDQPEKAA